MRRGEKKCKRGRGARGEKRIAGVKRERGKEEREKVDCIRKLNNKKISLKNGTSSKLTKWKKENWNGEGKRKRLPTTRKKK